MSAHNGEILVKSPVCMLGLKVHMDDNLVKPSFTSLSHWNLSDFPSPKKPMLTLSRAKNVMFADSNVLNSFLLSFVVSSL